MSGNSPSNPEFMAFLNDEATASVVREWAERNAMPRQNVQLGGSDAFMAMLDSKPPPKFAVVDLDDKPQPTQTAARLVSLCGPIAKIVAIGSANDVGVYRSMVAAGLTDYMVKPVTPEALSQAMAAAVRGGGDALKASEPKVAVVIGVRGGVGASTLAVNLGWIAAHDLKHKSAILDLDLHFGTCALALDLEPGRGLRDIVSSPQRVDHLMVSSAMASESENLSLLGAEESVSEIAPMDATAVLSLIKELRLNYRAVVVDMPRHLLAAHKRALTAANEIILVTELSLSGIRDTLRIKQAIKDSGTQAKVTIAAAKIGQQHPAAVDEASFVKSAHSKVDYNIADDHKNVTAANNAGKSVPSVAPQSQLAKTMREIAVALFGENKPAAATAKKGFFGLLGGKSSGEKK